MRLTPDFTLSEFTSSATAARLGITNEPGDAEKESLYRLCVRVLQPLRDVSGKPLLVNSGYRCPELNKAVGGVHTSQHLKGEAADIRVDHPRKLLSDLLSIGVEFDQAILYPTFLHISYRSGSNRKQVLYAKGVTP